jgi:cytochrome c-type biogenesis protein CcmH/NrfG
MKLGLGAEPAYLPGWLLLAKTYQVENKKSEVVRCLEQAFKLRPDLQELKFLLKTAEEIQDIRQLIIPGGISPDILE